MVVKTDTCFYTEFKIFPGRGIRLVRKDGKLLAFIDRKSKSLYNQKIKAQKLTWTQQWRARHKKGRVELQAKKKAKRATKVYKSIQGLDVEELKKKRLQKPDFRKAARDASLREVKERKRKGTSDKKKPAEKKAGKGAAAPKAATGFVKVPKSRRIMKGGPGNKR